MTYDFPPGTICVEGGFVVGVHLPLSREEWWRMCVRDGVDADDSLYIGPCCGNTGRAQDIVCHWMRMNSVHGLSAFEIREGLADLHRQLRSHDGWNEEDVPDLRERAEEDPWARLLLLYEAVRDRLKPRREAPDAVGYDPADPEAALRVLGRHAELLSWSTFGSGRPSHMSLAWRTEQLRVLLPAIRTVFHRVESLAPPTLSGWAIVDATGALMRAAGGPAVFATEAEAQDCAARWRHDSTREFGVRPCTVTLQDGIVLTETP